MILPEKRSKLIRQINGCTVYIDQIYACTNKDPKISPKSGGFRKTPVSSQCPSGFQMTASGAAAPGKTGKDDKIEEKF